MGQHPSSQVSSLEPQSWDFVAETLKIDFLTHRALSFGSNNLSWLGRSLALLQFFYRPLKNLTIKIKYFLSECQDEWNHGGEGWFRNE